MEPIHCTRVQILVLALFPGFSGIYQQALQDVAMTTQALVDKTTSKASSLVVSPVRPFPPHLE
jgi:hypothetical protein